MSISVRENAQASFFRSITRPHPLRRILFYSSDRTLNLGHHLDRENRPHIRGWWAATLWVCVCVCGMWRRVVTGFLILPGAENQIKLTFQPNALPTIFFFQCKMLLPLTSRIQRLLASPASPASHFSSKKKNKLIKVKPALR